MRAALAAIAALALSCASGIPQPHETTGTPATATPAGASGATAAPATSPPADSGWLEVRFLDVGQGDGALVRTPTGKHVLIDAGPRSAGPNVVKELRAAGVKRIDLFVWSHPHEDHIGGARDVLDAFEVKSILDSGYPHATGVYRDLLAAAKTKGIDYKLARAGRDVDLGGGATMHVLGPSEPFLTGTRSDPNSNSVVVRIVHGAASFLFTGDSEKETEDRIVAGGAPLKADVLKVAHHGSRYASHPEILGRVAPALAVVSVGAGNTYGHPAPETLDRLAGSGAAVLRTDLNGTVRVATDGKRLEVTSSRGGDAAAFKFAAGSRAPPGPAARHATTTALTAAPHPVAAPATAAVSPAPAPVAAGPAGKALDLNVATAAELEKLPGIGATKAAAIVADRAASGRFEKVDDLLRVKGIGPKTLEKLRSHVTVGP